MNFVTMYKDPQNLVAYNLLKMDNLLNHKLIIPKFHLLKLAELWNLKKKDKIEYRVQENMYNYLLAGFSYIGFFEKESDKENLYGYIDNYLLNCSEDMMTDLYDKMTNPKDGYAPFIVVELR
jgi:hypothetical protein